VAVQVESQVEIVCYSCTTY